jgi:hypothetical protein
VLAYDSTMAAGFCLGFPSMPIATTQSLASLAAVHNWLSRQLPLGQSLASVRLFIALGSAAVANVPVSRKWLEDQRALERGQPGADMLVAYRQAGLLTLNSSDASPETTLLGVTPRLREMVDAFNRFHDDLWVPRERYRSRLHCSGLDEAMSALVAQLFDEFLDCDYLHGYGSGCVRVSHLLAEAARLKGHRARVVPCWSRLFLVEPRLAFELGRATPKPQPGQIDAHVVCVIDDKALLDFGMGAARRQFSGLVPWAVALPFAQDPELDTLASTRVAGRLDIDWFREGFGDSVFGELSLVERELPEMIQPYRARVFGTPH